MQRKGKMYKMYLQPDMLTNDINASARSYGAVTGISHLFDFARTKHKPSLVSGKVVKACLQKEQVSPYFPPSHRITASKNRATLHQTTVDVVNHNTH